MSHLEYCKFADYYSYFHRFGNHEKSRKHRENVALLKQALEEEELAEDSDDSSTDEDDIDHVESAGCTAHQDPPSENLSTDDSGDELNDRSQLQIHETNLCLLS